MFDHETLDCYRLAVPIARWVLTQHWPPRTAGLRDQLERASSSMVLNIAEGRARMGKAGRNHYRIARGSAAECCSVLDIVCFPDGAARQVELRRIGAMLTRMMTAP